MGLLNQGTGVAEGSPLLKHDLGKGEECFVGIHRAKDDKTTIASAFSQKCGAKDSNFYLTLLLQARAGTGFGVAQKQTM